MIEGNFVTEFRIVHLISCKFPFEAFTFGYFFMALMFLTLLRVRLKAYFLNCFCIGPQTRNFFINFFFPTRKGKYAQNYLEE